MKFDFDLDGDGEKEQISRFASASGYLAELEDHLADQLPRDLCVAGLVDKPPEFVVVHRHGRCLSWCNTLYVDPGPRVLS